MINMKRIFFFAVVYCICESTAVSVAQSLTSQEQQQQQTQSNPFQSPYSQTTQTPSAGTTSMFTSSSEFYRNLQSQITILPPPPYDMPVDTNKYVIGPGDIINVGMWGPTPISLNLSVNPEGTLIIPTYGELKIGGMTLADAKAYARKKLGEQFRKSDITLTLIYPRTFYVVVAGRVKTPARYTSNAFDRVDRVFTLSNLPLNSSDTSRPPDFSLRRIKLIHSNGTSENVDLLKFYQTGNYADDPYLQQGDAIVVPEENFMTGSISISGAVRMPGTYEYVRGDKLEDLLEISQGLTPLADSAHVKVYIWDGSAYFQKAVDLNDSSAIDIPLPVNSRVIVPTDRKKVNDSYVWVSGEVESPGIYPVLQDSTRLSDLVGMAGGFTKWASLPSAVVYRIKQPEVYPPYSQINPNVYATRASGLSQEDLSYALQELSISANKEIVSTNFVKLFVDKDESYDCTLRSGDSVYVPRSQLAVYVFGQIKYPGYVDYRDGWSYSDYVNAAGGYTDGAETANIKILKHGTYQWYDIGDTHIEPGDLLFVSRVSIKPELYSWNMFKDIFSLFGTAASLALTAIATIEIARGK